MARRRSWRRLTAACLALATATYSQGIITTVAGTDFTFPTQPLPALDAPLGNVTGVVYDAKGNLYVVDSENSTVVRISLDGTLAVVAGNGKSGFSGDGGPAVNASLSFPIETLPTGVALDPIGNLYIADAGNHRIRKVTPGGIITTIAGNGAPGFAGDGGPATSALLNNPKGVAVDAAGDLYIADFANHRIRKVGPGGIITTVAGNGTAGFAGDGGSATNTALNYPTGIAADTDGNLYIADSGNSRIRKVTGGIITTVAGSGIPGFSSAPGPATSSNLNEPRGVAVDTAGNLYIADAGTHLIRKVTGGIITTVAGSAGNSGFSGDGGRAINALLNGPTGVAPDANGNLAIADTFNRRVRKVIAQSGTINTIAGSGVYRFSGDGGPATSASLNTPTGVAVDTSGNVFIADFGNYRIRKVSGGTITTVAGNGLRSLESSGPATGSPLLDPRGVAVDAVGNVYIAEAFAVGKVSGGTIIPIQGVFGCCYVGVAVDSAGSVYIADSHGRVLKVSGGTVSTIAGTGAAGFSGDGGLATLASLNGPVGVAVDIGGNVYIADSGNHRIRKVSGGTITTVAGNGTPGYSGEGGPASSSSLNSPSGVAVDAAGNLYIADSGNGRIRKVSGGIITTVAGNGKTGLLGDGGPATSASLNFSGDNNFPSGVALDSAGNIYIADTFSHRIRELPKAPPSYQTSPVTLSFSATASGTPSAAQVVSLSPATPGLGFTASTDADWLSVSPSSGAMPAQLQVTADPSSLAAGTNQATITITAANAVPRTATVAVTLTVQASQPPAVSVDIPSLSFSTTQGGGSETRQIHIINSGGGSLAFTVSATTASGGSWLSVAPPSGAATSSPVTLNVTVNPGSFAPSTYSGTITISGAGSIVTVPVTLSVAAPDNVILLSQSGLRFQAVAQGGLPLPQSFGILNTGQGSMSWTASVSTLSGRSGWLSIDRSSGTVDRPYLDVSLVNVSINPAGLAPGEYYGRIQVTAPAANSPQAITVILMVVPAGSSQGPEVQPTGLIFTGVADATPGSQDVLIGNPKAQPDNYISGSIGTGFSFLPTNAQVQPNQPTTVHVYPDFSKLQAGTIQRGTITLQFADGTPRNISVLTVVAPAGASSASSSMRSVTDGVALVAGCVPRSLQLQPTTLTDPSSSVTLLQPATLQVRTVDDCGNAVTSAGGAVAATFTNGDAQVKLAHIGNGNWQGTWTPRNGSKPQVGIQLNAFLAQGVSVLGGVVNLAVTVRPASSTPVTFGAANAASGVGTYISPGGLVSIYGQQLADTASTSGKVPFPTEVNGTEVLMGGKPLPLRYVGTGQVNAQVPFELGINTPQQLIVQHGTTLSVPQDVVVAAAQPAVYTQDQSGRGTGVIANGSTNTLITSASPAHAGDVVVIYCNGLGAVNPPVPTGTAAPAEGQLSRTANALTLTIGGVAAQVQFAGLTPGYPDLYQVNAVVPSGVTPGDQVPVVLTIAGQTSPPVTVSIR